MLSDLVGQLKFKCWLKKPTHDDIIEVSFHTLSFARHKGKLVLQFLSPSVYLCSLSNTWAYLAVK